MSTRDDFQAAGFLVFAAEDSTRRWVDSVLAAARAAVLAPENRHWLRCGGTWFVGVDALPNDAAGAVAGGPALAGAAADFIRDGLGLALPFHRAQVSVCYPGYPQPSADESPPAFAFRRNRDAAHVDGLLAEGPERRRFLREPHAYVLGIGLTASSGDAAPLVVWEGSHRIMGQAFAAAFGNLPPDRWAGTDVTDAYQAARREAFARCRRRALPLQPGEACLLHRHLLHGVAPWGTDARSSPDGRMTAYFRPQFADVASWASLP